MLKKQVLTLLLCFTVFTSISNAQNFGGGIIGGLSISQLSGDQLAGYDKGGILFGFFTNRTIGKKLLGKMELIYIQKGSKNPEKDERHEYLLNYIEIPILLQYNIQQDLRIEGGVQLAILIKEKEQDTFGIEQILRESFNKNDISISVGLEYKLTENIWLNSRLSNTLFFAPIRKHSSNATNWYNQGQYNNVVSFSFNYYI